MNLGRANVGVLTTQDCIWFVVMHCIHFIKHEIGLQLKNFILLLKVNISHYVLVKIYIYV